jgi:uncharacterized protein with GYD domain
MPTFISLANWTELGVREMRNSPQRLDSAKSLAKQFGGEIEHFYLTMGECDMIIVSTFPSDTVAAQFALHLTKGGAIRMKTLTAFTEPAYRDLIRSVG